MSKMGDFVAFQAAIALHRQRNMDEELQMLLEDVRAEVVKPLREQQNLVKRIYEPFSDDELSAQIASIVTPDDLNAEVQVVYQSVADLHLAIPEHRGDWYFTGDYPTPGGVRVANRAFLNYMEGKNIRAYA